MTQHRVALRQRVILRTLDGQVVVRPKAPDSITGYNKQGEAVTEMLLTEEGKQAWDAGEELSWELGHFSGILDLRGLARCEF